MYCSVRLQIFRQTDLKTGVIFLKIKMEIRNSILVYKLVFSGKTITMYLYNLIEKLNTECCKEKYSSKQTRNQKFFRAGELS